MNLDSKNIHKYEFSYWHAFLIPFIVMVAGCIGSSIFPFGDRSFLRNDLYNQYVQFFQGLHDKIWQGEGLAYSMKLGLGSGFAALYGYYLASPINWLVVLVPKNLIAEFITVLILVKQSLAGVSFAYYLRKRFGKEDLVLLCFSSAYALSGFMAAYQWNIMWLDVIVLAPLVIFAVERLVEEGKGSSYCILLALSIYTNFYLSIMLCMFLVLYFLMLILWKPWKTKVIRALQFAWYSLLAGGMSGVMLVPVYFALSGTEFHEFRFPETAKWYMNFLEEISRHCINVSMKVQADHWPNIYCGVAIFLLVPLFIFNKKISWKDKLIKIFLMGVFLCSFAWNYLDFIWHGMNYPDSLPGRQGYLYIWLLLVMGYQVYINSRQIRARELLVSGLTAYGLVIAAWVFTEVEGTNQWTYILTLIFVTLYLGVFILRYLWKKQHFRAWACGKRLRCLVTNRYLGIKMIVLVLVIVELSCNMYLTSIRTVNRTKFREHYTNGQDVAAWMKAQDEDLYRTEVFGRLTKNDGMMWGIHTATLFSSTANANVVDFYQAMGLGTTRVSYWHQGATPLVSALLGVRYMIGQDADMDNDLYEMIYTDGKGYLYRNRYSLPMGYVLDTGFDEAWDLSVYHPIEAQNNFCKLLGVSGDLLIPIPASKQENGSYTITGLEDGYIYINLGKNSISEIKVQIGDRKEHFKQVSFDYLLDLGYVQRGQEAKVQVVKEDQKFRKFEAYQLNLRVLEEAIDILNQQTLAIKEHDAGYLLGEITMKQKGTLVIPIAMENGWSLKVNGEEKEIETFSDTFIAVTLEPGEYELELEFQTPGMGMGLLLSVVSILLFGISEKMNKKRV